MENNFEPNMEQEAPSGKNTSYAKVIVIFSVAMAALLFGLNYLFSHIF